MRYREVNPSFEATQRGENDDSALRAVVENHYAGLPGTWSWVVRDETTDPGNSEIWGWLSGSLDDPVLGVQASIWVPVAGWVVLGPIFRETWTGAATFGALSPEEFDARFTRAS